MFISSSAAIYTYLKDNLHRGASIPLLLSGMVFQFLRASAPPLRPHGTVFIQAANAILQRNRRVGNGCIHPTRDHVGIAHVRNSFNMRINLSVATRAVNNLEPGSLQCPIRLSNPLNTHAITCGGIIGQSQLSPPQRQTPHLQFPAKLAACYALSARFPGGGIGFIQSAGHGRSSEPARDDQMVCVRPRRGKCSVSA